MSVGGCVMCGVAPPDLPILFALVVQTLVREGRVAEALTRLDAANPEAAALFAEGMRPFMNDAPASGAAP